MEPLKIIARYADGKILKGTTDNFSPDKVHFKLDTINGDGVGYAHVNIADLKAIFFVKDFEGRPDYQEKEDIVLNSRMPGRKVRVTFKDEETVEGAVLDFTPSGAGFFLFPADPESNNQKVFVVNIAVHQIVYL